MRTDTAKAVHLASYRPTDYLIDEVRLDIALHLTATKVRAVLSVRPNPAGVPGAPLRLDGDGLTATLALLDGEPLGADALMTPDSLTIATPLQRPFTLTIDTVIDPSANTQLMGLYRSGSAYCTQCEAEGFRRITYFLDRPDVLSVYTTRIEADRTEAPVLLGNGDPVESGELDGGRHFAVWHDPHPKPCYLFALVGGDLASIHDTFTTMDGREVRLGIYVEPGKQDRAYYAMDALKRCMRWDEEAFGRAYDLDVFNVVAVSDFNMARWRTRASTSSTTSWCSPSRRPPPTPTTRRLRASSRTSISTIGLATESLAGTGSSSASRKGLTGLSATRNSRSDERSRARGTGSSDVRALQGSVQFPEDAEPLFPPGARPEPLSGRSTTSTRRPSTRRAPRSSEC